MGFDGADTAGRRRLGKSANEFREIDDGRAVDVLSPTASILAPPRCLVTVRRGAMSSLRVSSVVAT